MLLGQRSKLIVDERQQPRGSVLVAVTYLREHLCYIAHRSRLPHILRSTQQKCRFFPALVALECRQGKGSARPNRGLTSRAEPIDQLATCEARFLTPLIGKGAAE